MPEFVPSGYLSIHEALNRLGRELFPSAWTGEEHKARRGLISEEDWSRIKDLPPARGGGAGIEIPRTKRAPATKAAPHTSGDPSDPLYQEEYKARQRHVDAQRRLRQMLDAGELEAAILDPWTGKLHQASASLWRRHDADRMIEKGQAPIPALTRGQQADFLRKTFASYQLTERQIREIFRAVAVPPGRPKKSDKSI